MRILLIEPPTNCFTRLIKRGYPIGLCSLAAIAKKEGVGDVKVYDVDRSGPPLDNLDFANQRANMARFLAGVNNTEHPVWQELRRTLEEFRPDVVGITTMTIQYASALRVGEVVKKWSKDCTVLMGGAHASVMPRTMIEWPYVDAVVKGEGEDAFREIIHRLGCGGQDLAGIPGVITKHCLDQLDALPLEVDDPDALPFPDRSALMAVDRYSAEDMGLMVTSRGCPFRCTYCSNFSRKTRFRSVENVLAEVDQVRKAYGTTQFMFKDDSFTVNRRRVEALCKTIIERRIPFRWEATTRLDLLDDSLIRLMKKAGCNRIGAGVESGDEAMLKVYNKRLTKDQIRKAASILRRNRVFWTAYFMMALPMEREEQIHRSLQFMKELRPRYAAIAVYKAYPGTKLFTMAEELGLVDSKVDNDHFFLTNPVDYFLKDPKHRCVYIPEERLNALTAEMEREFERSNKSIPNMLRRALSRYELYLRDRRAFLVDLRRALRWRKSKGSAQTQEV